MLEVIQNVPQNLLFNIGIILIIATFFAYIARIFRQPLIPAYIIAGLVLGPVGFGIIKDYSIITSISEIGIIFLLFIVGLEMDLKKLKTVGTTIIVTGILQITLTFFAGFFIASLFGFNAINSVYAGLIITFSSTMIVVKLLFDEDELNTLHGRIILGILFIQDLFAIVALSILLGNNSFSLTSMIPILIKMLILIAVAFIINRFIAHPLFKFAAKSSELLFLLSLAICFLFSLAAYFLDFSIAIGAFFGGLTLANLPYNLNIISRISSLKDFFATIFFVSLGLQLIFVGFSKISTILLIFLLIVILLKPLIVMIILSLFGYDKRNSFVSSVALAQISEFGLILALSATNISSELFSITIILGVISIGLTSYIMKYELPIYTKLSPVLSIFEKLSKKKKVLGYESKDSPFIILFGADQAGGRFLQSFKEYHKKTFVVDFNPEIIENLKKRKISCLYGDMSNLEILKRINFHSAKVIVSTIPSEKDNKVLIDYIKEIRSNAIVIITARTEEDALEMYNSGADYVIIPYVKSGEIISGMLTKYIDNKKGLQKLKDEHIKKLQKKH
jgi:Kef-type K+ transport system membrane component KefB